VHGLIFFYLQKFTDSITAGRTSWGAIRAQVATSTARYLPSGVYDDADAVQLLGVLATETNRPLPDLLRDFGEFLAPQLLKVAGTYVDPSWRTLDLIENTEKIIHTMVRAANPGAAPPVLETVRPSMSELHLVYTSRRQLCPLAVGLMRGIARHYGEQIVIGEPSCMLRGDPFCSFTIEVQADETTDGHAHLAETLELPATAGQRRFVQAPAAGEPTVAVPPVTIGGYRVLQTIGQGGMGIVYLGRDDRLDRDVAIKVMLPAKARDPVSRERFLREGRSTAAVDHPHVITIHQVGEHEGLPYLVMQRLSGCTLQEYVADAGRPMLAEALRIGREVAEGLAAAHAKGLIHRDIKPSNIFLQGPSRQVKLIDFGLAMGVDGDATDLTIDGSLVGTPAYMAPERIDDGRIDATSDLFGLGVVLYELLSGKLPFAGSSVAAILAAIARCNPRHLHEIVPDLPTPVADLVMKLLARDKADRPSDALSVARDLAAIAASLPAGPDS
jgi:tRNA A-37 threonylcarbamoyl transferase component Bud32